MTTVAAPRRPANDENLIDRVRAGDRAAEQALYRMYAHVALRRARQLGAQPADAEDYVAEAFLRLLRQLRQGRGPDKVIAPYLCTVVRNLVTDDHRGQRGREFSTDQIGFAIEPVTLRPAPDDEVEARISVRRAMDGLPQRWRDVLWRMHVEGKSPSAVAAEMGGTAQSVSALAFRARRALRDAYERCA